MGLFYKYSGYRIPPQNLSEEIRGMKTDMAGVKNAGWLISGSSVPLSDEQRNLLCRKISRVEDDIKDTKRNVFIWGVITVFVLTLYKKEIVLLIFPQKCNIILFRKRFRIQVTLQIIAVHFG